MGRGSHHWPVHASCLIEMSRPLLHVFWYILETTQLMPNTMVAGELHGTLLKADHNYEVVVELTRIQLCAAQKQMNELRVSQCSVSYCSPLMSQ
jgi:hypothetical protein